jgi:CspA family cold shock protein
VKDRKDDTMTQGTIKTLRDDRGFGFIKPDSGSQDLFFHSSAVEYPTFDELREGQRVEFEAGEDPRSPTRQRAEHVRLTETTATADMVALSAATE